MKPLKKGTCALCQAKNIDFVKSHIIPKSFYDEFGKGEAMGIISDNTNKPDRKTRVGLHSSFLCNECEKKFNVFDEPMTLLLKQKKQSTKIFDHEKANLWIIENAINHINTFTKFALSILWRAKVSGDEVYKSMELGPYQERIRIALRYDDFKDELLNKSSLYIRLFKKHDNDLLSVNAAFEPYTNQTTQIMKKTYGNFKYHRIGFPWGEFIIKVGGEANIKQGYFKLDNSFKFNSTNTNGVLWTSNLSSMYPHLLIAEESSRPAYVPIRH
jgi:hypothetical protein